MITQEPEIPNGWPLGLENMNLKLRLPEHIEIANTAGRNSFRVPSSSFSSFSSSNLDTESSASFFQDHSVSLGRLIGIRHGDGGGGRLYFPNAGRVPTEERLLHSSEANEMGTGMEMSCGICIPQLCNVIVKMSRSKSSPRRLSLDLLWLNT